ncbi:hypothetical protein BGZ76_006399 [Entomortierella beljakovae]|nr:hypothetical protein BGZ76_006399 [Entomortierella beljakovae]
MDKELANIQGSLAHATRPIDTLAHELVKNGVVDEEWCDQTMGTLYSLRVMLERIATSITRVRQQSAIRSKGYLVEAKSTTEPVVTMEMLAEAKKFTETVNESSRNYKSKEPWRRRNQFKNKDSNKNNRGRSPDRRQDKYERRNERSSPRQQQSRSPSPNRDYN